jgi:hypothetical protein
MGIWRGNGSKFIFNVIKKIKKYLFGEKDTSKLLLALPSDRAV